MKKYMVSDSALPYSPQVPCMSRQPAKRFAVHIFCPDIRIIPWILLCFFKKLGCTGNILSVQSYGARF